MKRKRHADQLTIEAALEIVRQILTDNTPGSGNTFEGSLGPPTSERCQALYRLMRHAQVNLNRERDRAWKRKPVPRG